MSEEDWILRCRELARRLVETQELLAKAEEQRDEVATRLLESGALCVRSSNATLRSDPLGTPDLHLTTNQAIGSSNPLHG